MSEQETLAAAAQAFAKGVEALYARGEEGDVPDEVLQTIFSAAVRAYAARVEKYDREPAIVDTAKVTATEGVTAACALIRAVDLNMFDVTMWYNRSGNNRV